MTAHAFYLVTIAAPDKHGVPPAIFVETALDDALYDVLPNDADWAITVRQLEAASVDHYYEPVHDAEGVFVA